MCCGRIKGRIDYDRKRFARDISKPLGGSFALGIAQSVGCQKGEMRPQTMAKDAKDSLALTPNKAPSSLATLKFHLKIEG